MNGIKVSNLSKIDPTKYIEGSIFITDKNVAILHGGKVETLVKQSDVRKLVKSEVKKAVKASE